MPNILDYVDWRGDITFDKSPFNDIDNLIFTQLSYINFDGIVPSFNENGSIKLSYAADRFFHVHGEKNIDMGILIPDSIITLLKKVSCAPRFKDLALTKYINKIKNKKTLSK